MYEQAVPVRARIVGQTSGPLSQHAPFCQRGTDGDIRLGNADATPYNWQEGIETSSDTYEKPEVVKQQELPPQGDYAQRTGVKFAENIDATSSTHTELRVGTSIDRDDLLPRDFCHGEKVSALQQHRSAETFSPWQKSLGSKSSLAAAYY
ncbi:hypothetical protein Bbelb_350710 [Branchiostoma belcheri]|nr:hypothetical protein Bbelb_350710 [Branchiostoma belcheri]